MRIIHHVPAPCDCRDLLEKFEALMRREGKPLGIGSIVECHCGSEYQSISIRTQSGPGWQLYRPDPILWAGSERSPQ